MLILNCLTIRPVERDKSYSGPINFPFSLVGICLPHDIPEAFHYFDQPALILFVKSSSISPFLCIIDPK